MQQNVRINKLVLQNYRNHRTTKISTDKDVILIYGNNGSGKTNLLESISLLNTQSGFKKSRLNEIINNRFNSNPELFGVNYKICSNGIDSDIGVGITNRNGVYNKIIKIDNKISSSNKLNSLVNVFWIIPRMSFIFQTSSEDRREFVDQMISSFDPLHRKRQLIYEKCKKERMNILKLNKGKSTNSEWLDIVEKKMASVGIMICDSRRSFLKSICSEFDKIQFDFPVFTLKMNGQLDSSLNSFPALQVEDEFSIKLKENREKDFLTGRTNFSVNKTDLIVYERKEKKLASSFSTGEQKIIIILTIFSFLKFLKAINYNNLIFLLDDIFSFLDKTFMDLIFKEIFNLNIQTWITDVNNSWVGRFKGLENQIELLNIDDNRFKLNKKMI